ncbi:hypothetical protein BJ508DRAFT_417003 [Ascobolus immersus RN42]|uniref:FabD/lysophospholipase-like protein n=1 Tax=Ascobolus immersus RN42 TaxID=1160509 RepID=A0A3N4I021_ASCIM|nr:hypothetical protein BJ508DRAFT_417003 [Ascobolus immersus RN42]
MDNAENTESSSSSDIDDSLDTSPLTRNDSNTSNTSSDVGTASDKGKRLPNQCDFCDKVFPEVSFCNVCQQVYCDRCWKKLPTHKRNALGQGGVPHERTEEKIGRAMNDIFYAEYNKAELEMLHMRDRQTRWFGISHKDHGGEDYHASFQTTRRFQNLLDPVHPSCKTPIFPSIVSFVGETGAGKSTLIKALIETSNIENTKASSDSHEETQQLPSASAGIAHQPESPVVGSVYDGEIPASGDVHLYADPRSINSEFPILFADCEGIRGGNREPMAETLWKQCLDKLSEGREYSKSYAANIRKLRRHRPIDRDISWAICKDKQTRQYAVEHMYPRILYAFSDTIVFITKNPKVIESVIEQLIEWADSALEYSLNQPTLPSALIVLNAVDNRQVDAYWSPDKRTSSIFESVKDMISKNSKFSTWVDGWNSESPDNPIRSVQDLISRYYKEVRIISIPEFGRPTLIHKQLRLVYGEITKMSHKARQRKKDARMLLTYTQMLPYLNSAFDHFAKFSDRPFNFVECAFRENPIPDDFGGGILQLLIGLLRSEDDKTTGGSTRKVPLEQEIYNESSQMIAGAILLDCTRNNKIGHAKQIIYNYLGHIARAIEEFHQVHYPCSFELRSKRRTGGKVDVKRCVNVRARHSKGHQSSNGKIIGPNNAEFGSKLSQGDFQQLFENNFSCIYAILVNMLREIQTPDRRLVAGVVPDEAQRAAVLHQSEIFVPFFTKHKTLKSSRLCFICLAEVSRYSLRCQHSICELCLKTFGTTVDCVYYRLSSCPFCSSTPRDNVTVPYNFSVTITEASPCILSLDGGGIRGIVQLKALCQLEREIGLGIPLIEFFDVVVGTSCGGIIALGLSVDRWPVEKCYTEFQGFCKESFQPRSGSSIPVVGTLIQYVHHNSRYQTKSLENSLQRAFGSGPLFGYKDESGHARRVCATAITATTWGSDAVVIGNYARKSEWLNGVKLNDDYRFHSPIIFRPEAEFKIWEAARATSAAPSFFKPYEHAGSGLVLQDGGLSYNNPIEIASSEGRKVMAGPSPDSVPDVLLSIGTGFSLGCKKKKRDKALEMIPNKGIRQVAKIAYNAVENSMDANRAWKLFIARNRGASADNEQTRCHYMRLNLPLDERPDLSDFSAIPSLSKAAEEHFRGEPQVKIIANRLIASLFYFHLETVEPVDNDPLASFICKGTIRSRLQYKSEDTSAIANLFRKRLPMARFVISSKLPPHAEKSEVEELKGRGAIKKQIIPLSSLKSHSDHYDEICQAAATCTVWGISVSFQLPHQASQTNITLETSNELLGSISAFPRQLAVEHEQRRKEATKAPEESFNAELRPTSGSSMHTTETQTNSISVKQVAEDWVVPSEEGLDGDQLSGIDVSPTSATFPEESIQDTWASSPLTTNPSWNSVSVASTSPRTKKSSMFSKKLRYIKGLQSGHDYVRRPLWRREKTRNKTGRT